MQHSIVRPPEKNKRQSVQREHKFNSIIILVYKKIQEVSHHKGYNGGIFLDFKFVSAYPFN